MEGANLIELVKRYNGSNFNYRCLVEAVIDHEMCPQDPLTDIVLKGAQGVAYAFWPWSGNWWELAMTVEWEPGRACNYIETYRRRDKIKGPITEIKFVREFEKGEILPKNNPLLIKK